MRLRLWQGLRIFLLQVINLYVIGWRREAGRAFKSRMTEGVFLERFE